MAASKNQGPGKGYDKHHPNKPMDKTQPSPNSGGRKNLPSHFAELRKHGHKVKEY